MGAPAAPSARPASPMPPEHRGLRDLLVELGDLKRVRSAGRRGSIAGRLFEGAWGALVAGEVPERVMRHVVGAALVATRLGDLDAALLTAAKLPPAAIRDTLLRGFDAIAAPLDASLRGRLRDDVASLDALRAAAAPAFVRALSDQPRAGVTCPGRARIVLEPPENHAEHCLVVAVYGALLAPGYGADPASAFLAGLAHHLHNALMPDSGFTGEMLLEPHLAAVMAAGTAMALAELDPPLREAVERARAILPDAETPEGRAFHAADVIDRVAQIAQHLRAATLTMGVVLDEMALVHDGPVKPFHDAVLAAMDLP